MGNQKKVFNCPQLLLYIIAEMGWGFCLQLLTRFSAYKAIYTPALIKEAQDKIATAKEIAAVTKRNEMITIARNDLVEKTKIVRKNFRDLQGYIKTAFKGPNFAVKNKAAGSDYYGGASEDNWESLHHLLSMSSGFINDNKKDLEINNNMPVGFTDPFLKANDDCAIAYALFVNSGVEKPIITKDKNNADNAIYTVLTEMFADGQLIFSGADEKGLKSKFTFSALYKIVKSKSPASLKGFMYYLPKKGLEGVTITSENGEYSTVTDKRGRYEFLQLSAGTYTFIFSKPGYKTVRETLTLKAGTAKHFKATLERVLGEMEVAA